MDQRYQSGEEIHIGDRVKFHEFPATIVFVIDRDEWPDEETAESRSWWKSEYESGFFLCQDGGGHIFLDEADEDLIFISRRSPSGKS